MSTPPDGPADLFRELTELRHRLVQMSKAVQQRVDLVVGVIEGGSAAAARTVRGGDDEIDALDLRIEAMCLEILALSQPVARDLRFVLAVLRIDSSLERIGDCERSIAQRLLAIEDEQTIELPAAVREMATRTQQMLRDALAAFDGQDGTLARRVRGDDDRVDELLQEVFAWAVREIPEHVDATAAAISVLSIARQLERIGDLATNIAEDVVFHVEGEVVRHEHS